MRALCEDREGNLWLGTYGSGLIRLQPRNVRALDSSVGLPIRPPVCLASDAEERTWIGFENGGLFVGADESFERALDDTSPRLRNLISSVSMAPDSTVWVATPGEGLYHLVDHRVIHYGTADGLSDDNVSSVAVDTQKRLWVGTGSGTVHCFLDSRWSRFGALAGLPSAAVTAILPTRDGDVWFGFGDGEVFRESDGRFLPMGKRGAFDGKAIWALNEDSAGRIWAGSAGGRLGCVRAKNTVSWEVHPAASADPVLGILTDEDGDLWIGTSASIYRITKNEAKGLLAENTPFRPRLIFRSDKSAESVPAYGWPRAARSREGKLWFALASGVVSFDGKGAPVHFAPPPIHIEQVTINGKPLPQAALTATPGADGKPEPIRFPSDVRSLDVEFTALELSVPERMRFRYRLDGCDPDWVSGGAVRSVHYPRLNYGVYTFHVEAGMADQPWYSNEASFQFVVPTPIWRTGWALGFYALAVLSLVAGVVRLIAHRRLRRRLAVLAAQQAMERERMRIAQDMHDEIGSKLTKISFMSERARKGELAGQRTGRAETRLHSRHLARLAAVA